MTTQPTPSRVETYSRKKKEWTEKEQMVIAQIVATTTIFGLFIGFFVFKNHYIEHKYDDVVASCRIQYQITKDDGNIAYLCQNKDMKNKSEYMVIDKRDSRKVDENPYINRPVKIFKDGTVE